MQVNKIIDCKPAIEKWIESNKPLPENSNAIAEAFINLVKFRGSDDFVLKMKKIIQKTSCLATGITILQRLLATKKPFEIRENPVKSCHGQDSIEFDFMHQEGYYCTMNEQGELELRKTSKKATFIHECLHQWHGNIDPKNFSGRSTHDPFLPDMDDQEEEFTITGNLHLEANVNSIQDFCCENSALVELGRDFKVNHQGVMLPKNGILSLEKMVAAGAFGSIRKMLQNQLQHDSTLSNNNQENAKPLETAFFKYFVELDSSKLKDWLSILELLLKAGFKSEYALKLAVIADLEEIAITLIDAGVNPSPDILGMAICRDNGSALWNLLKEQGYVGEWSMAETFDTNDFMTPEAAFHSEKKAREFERRCMSIKYRSRKKFSKDILEKLISAGAKPSEKDFMVLIRQSYKPEYIEILRSFLETGAKPTDVVIQYAIEQDCLDAVKLFLEFGMQPQSWMLYSALAHGERISKIPKLLVSKGLKPTEKDLQIAKKRNNYKIIELLEKVGTIPNDETIKANSISIKNQAQLFRSTIPF